MNITDASFRDRVENFVYYENKLLDDGEYGEWLKLLSSNYRCYMPIRTNVLKKRGKVDSAENACLSHYDEDIDSIMVRVNRYLFSKKTNMIMSESPEPFFIRYISNIYVSELSKNGDCEIEYNFITRRMRLEKEVDIFYGKKKDNLLYDEETGVWKIEKRLVSLASNLVASNNLNMIF